MPRSGRGDAVIDPRRSDVAKRATVHLQPRPGYDPAILASRIHVIIDENRDDRWFVEKNTRGIRALAGPAAAGRDTRPVVYRFLRPGELRSFRLGTRRPVSAEALAEFSRDREAAEAG
jgi:anaerobic selenocysteine-containing dehydrogenase